MQPFAASGASRIVIGIERERMVVSSPMQFSRAVLREGRGSLGNRVGSVIDESRSSALSAAATNREPTGSESLSRSCGRYLVLAHSLCRGTVVGRVRIDLRSHVRRGAFTRRTAWIAYFARLPIHKQLHTAE